MSSEFENNKRRFKRFPSGVKIKFRRLDLQDRRGLKSMLVTGTVKNVSKVGLFVQCDELFEEDSLIEIDFHFPVQDRQMKALARVIWSSLEEGNKGMGVELYKVGPDVHENLVSRAKRGNWVEIEEDENAVNDDDE